MAFCFIPVPTFSDQSKIANLFTGEGRVVFNTLINVNLKVGHSNADRNAHTDAHSDADSELSSEAGGESEDDPREARC